MVKGKNKDLVIKLFRFFAIFPEDVAIPAGFFNIVAPLLADEKMTSKKAKLAVGNGLGVLLKYNLIKGSLSTGHGGVFMHDIVRDYVINQHSKDDLQALQKSVVDIILAARPEPVGFLASHYTSMGTFENYVALHLSSHFAGAAVGGNEVGLEYEWLGHRDIVIKRNYAHTLGFDVLCKAAESEEAAGNLLHSAFCTYATALLKNIPQDVRHDKLYATADLLEKADDESALQFETEGESNNEQ